MKQPVSRSTFNARRGDTGVFLQEGAPLLDAVWNEAVDVQWTQLSRAIREAGLEGTQGTLLEVSPVYDDSGVLVNLSLTGGDDRFYCCGLPVLWPETCTIDAQPCVASEWITRLVQGTLPLGDYVVFLRADLRCLDGLDLPSLDDPGLYAERGSFRKTVQAWVGLEPSMPSEPRTNLCLSLEGTYTADVNALFWLELVGWCQDDPTTVELLWDGEAASVKAAVVSSVARNGRRVELATTEGFSVGQFVRFEGCEINGTIYQITAVDSLSISLERSVCGQPEVLSLTDKGLQVTAWEADPSGDGSLWLTLNAASELEAGMLLNELQDPQNLSSSVDPISDAAATWELVQVKDEGQKLLVSPYALTMALQPWNEDEASPLVNPAAIFDRCLMLEDRPDWRAGMRVLIEAAEVSTSSEPSCGCTSSTSAGVCQPGSETVNSDEIRSVMAIYRGTSSDGRALMMVRLDHPLSYPHTVDCRAVPERPIRARRYSQHVCGVKVNVIDPDFSTQGNACCYEGSPCCLDGKVELPGGLEGYLGVPKSEDTPSLEPGDGWHFTARAGGWWDPLFMAPAEYLARAQCQLARLSWTGSAWEITDLRPLPAAFAQAPALETIRLASAEIAALLVDSGEPMLETSASLAVQAALPRIRKPPLELLQTLAGQCPEAYIAASPLLARAAQELDLVAQRLLSAWSGSLEARDVTALSAVVGRFSLAFSMAHDLYVAASVPTEEPPDPVDALERDLEQVLNRPGMLTQRLETFARDIASLNVCLEEQGERATDAFQGLEALKHGFESLSARLEQEGGKSDAALRCLEILEHGLRTLDGHLGAQSENTQAALQALEATITQVSEALGHALSQAASSAVKIEALERACAEIKDGLEAAFPSLEARLNSAEGACQTLEHANNVLFEALRETHGHIHRVESTVHQTHHHLEQARAGLDGLQARESDLSTRLEALATYTEAVRQHLGLLDSLETTSTERISALAATLEQLEAGVRTLLEQRDVQWSLLHEVTHRLDAFRARLDAPSERLEPVATEVAESGAMTEDSEAPPLQSPRPEPNGDARDSEATPAPDSSPEGEQEETAERSESSSSANEVPLELLSAPEGEHKPESSFVRFQDLPTHALKAVQDVPPRRLEALLEKTPTLGEVLKDRTARGRHAQSLVASASALLVGLQRLQNRLERRGASQQLKEDVDGVWAKHLRGEVAGPAPELGELERLLQGTLKVKEDDR